jgi:hypothetical protein
VQVNNAGIGGVALEADAFQRAFEQAGEFVSLHIIMTNHSEDHCLFYVYLRNPLIDQESGIGTNYCL